MVKIEQFPALGTYWWVELFNADNARQDELTELITSRLTSFDATYSRFNPESLVYRLNTEGFMALDQVPDPDEFLELLAIGTDLHVDTEGVFNFLTAAAQVAAGYGGADSVRPAAGDTLPNPEIDLLITDNEIKLERGAVDLGGFAKGWLIDDLATSLREELGLEHFLINGGGDMFATSTDTGEPIEIVVEHPLVADTFIAKIPLLNQGFAASSTSKRTWEKDGTLQQHILQTHNATAAAHVIAADAMTADIFATLSCAVNPDDAPSLLESAGLNYLLMIEEQIAMTPQFEQFLLK